MKLPGKTLLAVMFSCGISAAVGADDQAAPQDRLEAQRDYYTRSLEGIDKQHAETVGALLAKYRVALEALRAERQKEGDLPGVLASKAELERLDKDGTPPGPANVSDRPKLQKLQTISINASGALEKETNQSILELVTNYVARLEAEKKRLTIAGQIDAAKAYNEEIVRVTNGAREQAVAKLVKSGPPDKTAGPADNGPADTTARPVAAGKSECRVFTGANPPPVPNLAMKRQDLYGTRLGGRISGISASAELGTKENIDTRRNTSEYSRSKTESGTMEHTLRLTLSTQGKDKRVADATLLVQYFGTEAGARGTVDPKEVGLKRVALKEISNQKVTIDFPAVSLEKYDYRSRSSYSSTYRSESGQEFYGVMVTVFDGNQEIIYQAVTRQTMVDFGELATSAVKRAGRQSEIDAARAAYMTARDEYHAAGDDDREKRRQAYERLRDRYQGLLREQEGR